MICRRILGALIALVTLSVGGGTFSVELGYPLPTWFYFVIGPVTVIGFLVFALGVFMLIEGLEEDSDDTKGD